MKVPRRYWLEQNRLPVTVLVVSSAVTVGAALIVAFLS